MSDLSKESCTACKADAPKVLESEKAELMAQIPEWQASSVEGVPRLSRLYAFENFVDALQFANKVGALAEQLSHHPKIVVEWGKVEVSWWTHKIKGLHRNDFVAAAKTDALAP